MCDPVKTSNFTHFMLIFISSSASSIPLNYIGLHYYHFEACWNTLESPTQQKIEFNSLKQINYRIVITTLFCFCFFVLLFLIIFVMPGITLLGHATLILFCALSTIHPILHYIFDTPLWELVAPRSQLPQRIQLDHDQLQQGPLHFMGKKWRGGVGI